MQLASGFGHHDHAGSAAVLVVVHLLVLAEAVGPQVLKVDLQQALVLCPFHDGVLQGAVQEFGQYGDDVYAHGWYFRQK
jgi:hypothetical protein